MTELEQELIKLVQDLRAENAALLEVILESQGLLVKEVAAITADTGTGRIPWYIRQKKLTQLFRTHKEEDKEANAGQV